MEKKKNNIVVFVLAGLLLCCRWSLAQDQPATDSDVDATTEPAVFGPVWHNVYGDALQEAREMKRPLLISFHAKWCNWCTRLEKEVFSHPDVTPYLKKYVCLSIDVDDSPQIARAYGVRSLPRTIAINNHNEIVGDWMGYYQVDEFIRLIRNILETVDDKLGATPMPKVPDELAKPSIAIPEQINTLAPKELFDMLGHKQKTVRDKISARLVGQGPTAWPLLAEALNSDYLGVRITAWKIIRRQKIDYVKFDPWSEKPQRAAMVEELIIQLQKKHPQFKPLEPAEQNRQDDRQIKPDHRQRKTPDSTPAINAILKSSRPA